MSYLQTIVFIFVITSLAILVVVKQKIPSALEPEVKAQ